MLNEWFFHDLTLENGETNFQETARFLIQLEALGTNLVIPSEKRWLDKAGRLTGNDAPNIRSIGRLFFSILRDSDRAIWTNYDEMQAVSSELYLDIPEEDIYLVKAYHCAAADLLVTTDVELFRECQSKESVNCQLRDQFLNSFPLQS